MKGLQIDIRGKIMNCVTPKGQVCVFVEADNMVVLGEDKEMSSMTDEDMLGYYNQLKKFLTKEGVLK